MGEDRRSAAKLANDARLLEYEKKKVVQLEQQLKSALTDLENLRTRPSLSTEREREICSF